MKISSMKYFTREASRNVFSNGWMSVASILTVVASLLVFGLFMILGLNLTYIAEQAELDYELILVLDESLDDGAVGALKTTIEQTPNVKEVTLDTNDQRLEELKKEMGSDAALLEGYDQNNPLRNWYRVTMTDLGEAEGTVAQLERLTGVVKIVRNQDTIQTLVKVTGYVRHLSLWVMAALAVVSVFIIANTIKLTVFARRKEINIMKFVGATDWFIRWPFVIEGIMIGFLGCLVSLVLLSFGYGALVNFVTELGIHFVRLVPLQQIFLPFVGLFLIMGAVMGGLGSLISVRKHLKV